MGKKSRKIKDTSEIITYTKEEKYNKIKELVTKLEMFGLSIYAVSYTHLTLPTKA